MAEEVFLPSSPGADSRSKSFSSLHRFRLSALSRFRFLRRLLRLLLLPLPVRALVHSESHRRPRFLDRVRLLLELVQPPLVRLALEVGFEGDGVGEVAGAGEAAMLGETCVRCRVSRRRKDLEGIMERR
jgi:hypothetical protein